MKLSDLFTFLELKLNQVVVLFFSCAILFYLSKQKYIYIKNWNEVIQLVLIVIVVLSFVTIIWKILYSICELISRGIRKRTLKKTVIRKLQSLSKREKELVNTCLADSQQTFLSGLVDTGANSLVAKKFVFIGTKSHNPASTLYIFHDDVWEILMDKQKDIVVE